MKILKPNEVESAKREINIKKAMENIPPEMWEAFNTLIAKKWNGYESEFTQKEVTELFCSLAKVDDPGVAGKGWLDVEDVYRQAGWFVTFEIAPYYVGSGASVFIFKRDE